MKEAGKEGIVKIKESKGEFIVVRLVRRLVMLLKILTMTPTASTRGTHLYKPMWTI